MKPSFREATRKVCVGRMKNKAEDMKLTSDDLSTLNHAILPYKVKYFAGTASAGRKEKIFFLHELIQACYAIPISYEKYINIIQKFTRVVGSKKAFLFLPRSLFIALAPNPNGEISGFSVLAAVHQQNRSLYLLQWLLGFTSKRIDWISEPSYNAGIQSRIQLARDSQQSGLGEVDSDFLPYYLLICARMLLLRHVLKIGSQSECPQREVGILIDDLLKCQLLHELFMITEVSLCSLYNLQEISIHPLKIRNIHLQYLQLDKDQNGMLSESELLCGYGKCKAFQPDHLHDLTPVFVHQLFEESRTFPPNNEMDYKTYVDFTLYMMDDSSISSLRFFWTILDVQKQGYLSFDTVDLFLRDVVEKIVCENPTKHDEGHKGHNDRLSFIKHLRMQVFDAVNPLRQDRITWQDLKRSKLGPLVVRLLVDYRAYRSFTERLSF